MCLWTIVPLAIVLAFIARALLINVYRNWFREGVFGDAAYHYCIVRALGRTTGNYEGVPEFFLRNGPDRYPIIFHRFASWFGLRTIENYPYLPNLLIFIGFTACLPMMIGLLPVQVFPASTIALPLSVQGAVALLTVFLFVTSVANNSLHGHGILFLSLSERLLAKLSVGLYFFSVLQWSDGKGNAFLAIGVVAGYVALASSMFARQALIFITLPWALFKLDGIVLVPLAGAFLLSTFIDRKMFILGLRDQWDFSSSYRMYTAKSRVFLDSLSKFTAFSLSRSIGSMIRQFLADEPGKSIFRHPDLILVLITGWRHLPPSFIDLMLATIAVYLLTTTRALRHFGESERYLDYLFALILPYMVAIEIMLQPTTEMTSTLLITAILYRVAFITYSIRQDSGRTVVGNSSLNEILVQAGVTKNSRVLPLPINLGQAISARIDCGVVCYPGVYGSWIFERYIDEYPLVKPKIGALINEFQITKIVVHKTQTDYCASVVGWSYDFSKYRKIAENEHWCCYDAC